MTSPIFLDTNVPIYVGGRAHPLRDPCVAVLSLVGQHPERFVTDAEVFQELLHRYVALRSWQPNGRTNFELFAELMRDRVEPVLGGDVEAAAALTARYPGLSARDLLHLAVMQRVGATRIVTADRGFDAIDGVERLDPADVATWRASVTAL